MRCKRSLTAAAFAALCSPGVAHAALSEGPGPVDAAIEQQAAMLSQQVGAGFGTGVNILPIPAAAFTPRGSGVQYDYDSVGYLYVAGAGDVMWAPIFLPQGASIRWLDLYAYDINSFEDISATIRLLKGYDAAVTPSVQNLVTVKSSGSSGYQYVPAIVNPTPPSTTTCASADGRNMRSSSMCLSAP